MCLSLFKGPTKKKSEGLGSERKELFVTYQEGKSNIISKDTIARWIVSTIKQAYSSGDKTYPDKPSAHDTRKLAVSWALFNGASIKEIMKAAHWSQENSFTNFYLKDVAKEESIFARASILGTIREGGNN